MMMRVCLFALAGLYGAAHTEHGATLRLQVEHDQRRRLQVSFPVPTWHGDINLDAMFSGTWNTVENFFTEDMVDWFEDDFADFFEDNFYIHYHHGIPIVGFTPLSVWEDGFTTAWDGMVDGFNDAWEWTETAWDTATTAIEETFWDTVCDIEENLLDDGCSECVLQVCSGEDDHPDVHVTEEKLKEMSLANSIALSDMAETFEPYIEGCASALESCPPLHDCDSLDALPDSTKYLVAGNIAQCNLCWQCLPYGSTQEGCRQALDQVMPKNCEGCTAEQQGMYNAFYSCSSMQVIHESIESVGEFYVDGPGSLDGPGRTYMDGLCYYCSGCSKHDTEIVNLCKDWNKIKKEWDFTAPEIPQVLNELYMLAPTPSPTPRPTQQWWIGPPRRM